MAARIDSHGEIETMIHGEGASRAGVGDRIHLVFRAIDDPDAPIAVVIQSPTGAKIVDRVLRELPTGRPQSAPPVEFVPSHRGEYNIEVREIRGKLQRGRAVLSIA
jgi:hypothetical protein